MLPSLRHVRSRALVLLSGLTIAVVALGWVIARDVRRFSDDAHQLNDRLLQGFSLVGQLQFETQEVRRILLYAMSTSDANRQLEYADQSRAADARVQRLLAEPPELRPAGTRALLSRVDRSWRQDLVVRDEVIGLILENSLPEGVALDEQHGTARFNEVRETIADLKAHFESDAAAQVREAEVRADRSMLRLALLVSSAIFVAVIGAHLVNRRRALEALLRSEAHKGSILQAVPNAIISTDAAGRIIELNDAAERAFGVSRAAALGARIDEIIMPAETRSALAALLSRDGDSVPTAVPRFETTGARRDGTTFPMELAAVSHTAGPDRIWTVHLSDLTERHRAEEQLRRAKETEVATQAKGDFLATISHELRTPLSGVIGIVDLLESAEPHAPQRELVRMLRNAATALFSVVNDILDYSKIEAGLTELMPVTFSVRQSVEDALDLITQPGARQGIELGYEIEPDVPAFVVADQDRVRQVLLNLLSNAMKFTEAGEVAVHVSAKRVSGDSVAISVAVRDTGCGIPAHLLQKLFHRFNQVDAFLTRRHDGTGLGLPISDSLSRLLGGSLTVETAEGRGSTFTLVFIARVASGAPDRDELDGSLSGIRVLAFLGPGIIGRQVRSLLHRWEARLFAVTDDDEWSPPPEGRFDAILVDAVTLDGRLHEAAVRKRALWRLQDVPVITVARLRAATVAAVDARDRTLGTPVRVQALYDAICAAAPAAAPAVQWPESRPEIRVFAPGALRILLVEDNDANRRILRLMIEELGLEVDEVASGLDAIARTRRHRYDVIFMDVRMPDLDGLETTRRIKAEHSGDAPVIIALTANVMRGEEARCIAAGMDGYLPKPLRLKTLAEVLGRSVDGRRVV